MSGFYRASLIKLFLICLTAVLLRITEGYFVVVMVIVGCVAALFGRNSLALGCYFILPLFAVANPVILPISGIYIVVERIGFVVFTIVFLLRGRDSGRQRIPILSIFIYLFCAVFSSMNGYMPQISYLKILNMAFFVIGLYMVGTKISHHEKIAIFMREFVFAIVVLIVFGSLFTLLVPHAAYYVSVSSVLRTEGVAAADQILSDRMNGLFCGIVYQSQALAPILVCIFVWIVCDFIVIQRGRGVLHIILIFIMPYLMYLTRSRTALLSLFVGILMILIYFLPRVNLSRKLKKRAISYVITGFICLVTAGIIMEMRGNGLTKWIRKVDDVQADDRSMTEAFTASRLGRIEECLYDFRKNPLLGMGFQVNMWTPIDYRNGDVSLLSAPVEKGFVPAMILGEGGIVGAIAFVLFLLIFYHKCALKQYHITIVMFTVYLSTNLAEATIFSPGGVGGILWIICLFGGFILDMTQKGILQASVMLVYPNSMSNHESAIGYNRV